MKNRITVNRAENVCDFHILNFIRKLEFTLNMQESISNRIMRSFPFTNTVCGIYKISYAIVSEDSFPGRIVGEGRGSWVTFWWTVSLLCTTSLHNTIPAWEGDHLLFIYTSEICIHVSEPPKLVLLLLRRLVYPLKQHLLFRKFWESNNFATSVLIPELYMLYLCVKFVESLDLRNMKGTIFWDMTPCSSVKVHVDTILLPVSCVALWRAPVQILDTATSLYV